MPAKDNWFFNFFYSPQKSKKSKAKAEKLPKLTPTVQDAPERSRPSDEELKGILNVVSIDLNIAENAESHHTDKYTCTNRRKVDGEMLDAELVLRRGQIFKVTVTFNRDYNVEHDDVKISFKTGDKGHSKAETGGKFMLDESGTLKPSANKWSGCITKRDGNTLHMDVHIPVVCAIGEWSFTICTLAKGTKKRFYYEHPDDIYILFNPWCKDDTTYIEDESNGTEEYVLNDHGCVYRGNAYRPEAKEWNFGQFEENIMEAAIYVIKKALKPNEWYKLADPVAVSRIIAQVVNCNDSDKGVLHGRWDGNYQDGESPMDWYGTPNILNQYMETGKSVKYGQCWVFSGVTTTVCRAIGLGARSVTNYGSAHDTDNSCTIDVYYHRDDDGNLVPSGSSDSIWNYHVWNECYMKRLDIIDCGEQEGTFHGWQVIDATPQEKSDGVFTCGPCPLTAIKLGMVNVPFDCGFIFSEVNADQAHFEKTSDGNYTLFKLDSNKVGKGITTKKADGKPYDRNAWFDKSKWNITHLYKFDNESEENRQSVMRAALGAENKKDVYTSKGTLDVEFKLLHEADLSLGQNVEVKLTAVNKSEYRRKVGHVSFRFLTQTYTGTLGIVPFKTHQIKDEIELTPNKVYEWTTTLKHDEYLFEIDEGRSMCIQAFALVPKTRSRKAENCVKSHNVDFGAPSLEIEMPDTAKVDEEIEATVTFNNPYVDHTLTGCKLGHEGRGFNNIKGLSMPDVPPLDKFKKTLTLNRFCFAGTYTVTFKFTSKELCFLSGSAVICVK